MSSIRRLELLPFIRGPLSLLCESALLLMLGSEASHPLVDILGVIIHTRSLHCAAFARASWWLLGLLGPLFCPSTRYMIWPRI